MSLDIWLTGAACAACGRDGEEFYTGNVTYNLGAMWAEAGVKDALYEAEGHTAEELLPAFRDALELMESDPPRFEKHDSPNGWGNYVGAVRFLRELVGACEAHPTAIFGTWR